MTSRKDFVKQTRLSLGLSQDQLASAMCLTRITITRWENGKVEISDDKLHHLLLFSNYYLALAAAVRR